jgi:hypothetical protein
MIWTLFSDPVRWARNLVGTRPRFVTACVGSAVFWVCTVATAHAAVKVAMLRQSLGSLGLGLTYVEAALWPLLYVESFVGCAAFPVTYLIALRALIGHIDRNQK